MELPQIQVKKILFATDLSESARYAFAYAVSLANSYGAGLVILHVLAEMPSLDASIGYHIGESEWKKIKAARMQEASRKLIGKKRDDLAIRDALAKFCANAQECLENRDVGDEAIVERGDPANQILRYAAAKSCDLIVMGRHGHSGIAEAVMGSTARRVLKKSNIPVLVVRSPL